MKRKLCLVLFVLFVSGGFISCATSVKKIQMIDALKAEKKFRLQADEMFVPEDTIKQKENDVPQDMSKIKIIYVNEIENPPPSKEYKVVKGDSLWAIARNNYGKGKIFDFLAEFNGIEAPYIIKENRGLKIPLNGEPHPRIVPQKVTETSAPLPEFNYRVMKNRTFGVGEKLVYAIKYFNVTAGFGTLEVKEITTINGRQAYHIVAEARTAPFFENFHRVRDTIESYMDVLGLFSHKYSKNLEEGKYKKSEFINFYPQRRIAIKRSGEQYVVPAYVQDVLSEMYFFRTMDINGKNEVVIDVCADDGKAYEVAVKKIGYERVSTDAGDFDCVVIKPMLKFEGIFQQKGEITIWMTNDENRIPVLVKSNIIIGSIDAVLQKATVVKAH